MVFLFQQGFGDIQEYCPRNTSEHPQNLDEMKTPLDELFTCSPIPIFFNQLQPLNLIIPIISLWE